MKKVYWLVIAGWTVASCASRVVDNQFLVENLMRKHSSKFGKILKEKDSLEVQIIYTQIDRDSLNQPHFHSYFFNVDSTKYFYPASTVKLPIALLALEKLNRLHIKGLDKFTPMFHDSIYSGQLRATKDSTSATGLPSVAHYVKKILLVSDNDASNRLYEFLGQKAANEILKDKGYNIRILHRLERPLNPDENRHTEAIKFVDHDTIVYQQAMLVNEESIKPPRRVFRGHAYVNNQNAVVHRPFDFTYKNSYPLQEQQAILKAILFPTYVDPQRRFNITDTDRKFVMQYMSQFPNETFYPAYHTDKSYIDSYCKFLLFAKAKRVPGNFRVFNKVGDAYGYLLDNAYIVDFNRGVEFMLSAVINTNIDGVYNDGLYEYEKIGYPFMRNLGRLIYKYEKRRKRIRAPKLDEFKFQYDRSPVKK